MTYLDDGWVALGRHSFELKKYVEFINLALWVKCEIWYSFFFGVHMI